jgi:hypothetical protein
MGGAAEMEEGRRSFSGALEMLAGGHSMDAEAARRSAVTTLRNRSFQVLEPSEERKR